MCGLFAGVGKLNSNRMIALGSMNEERGTDSVGIAYISENQIKVAKVAERPCVGLNITMRKEVTEAAVSGMFIGHTRQATQGSVTSRNAHPFLVDDIVFAHNGIIFNDAEFGHYEVDSECLIHGIKSKDFSKYEGPIALVWIEGGLLKAFRCGNPLYRGKLGGVQYLASDDDYLKAVGCTHVKELTEGMIYTFHNATSITTERVKKNKVYDSTPLSKYSYTSWEDYEKQKSILSPGERQKQWWNEKESGELEIDEDFRTPSDIAKEEAAKNVETDVCEMCGELGELTEGICLECITWLDDNGNGVAVKDLPPMLKGGC